MHAPPSDPRRAAHCRRHSRDDAGRARTSVDALSSAGRIEVLRGAKFSTRTGDHGLTVDVSQFRTDGYRRHSDAQRGQLNARWRHTVSPATGLSVVLNAVDQPVSHDPLGLTREQWQADPRQAVPLAFAQDARKTVRQQQLGAVLEHRLGEHTLLTGRVYAGAISNRRCPGTGRWH